MRRALQAWAPGLTVLVLLASTAPVMAQSTTAPSTPADPRLREVVYDARAVVTVPVKRGTVSLIVLDEDELITDVAAGLGGDCSKPEATWCIAAQSGSRHLFVKAKSTAVEPNNLAVVTDRRTHAFRFVVLGDQETRAPVYRLEVRAQRVLPPNAVSPAPDAEALAAAAPALQNIALLQTLLRLQAQAAQQAASPSPAQLVAERLDTPPLLRNSDYSLAEGPGSADIVPSLVFDDGRFTYLRIAGNRELPSVFAVLGDGSETLVNTRMEGDLMVVDRVSRRLMLRAGNAVVGIWNEAFDPDGQPPAQGTTVPGVQRVLRAPGSAPARP